MLFQRQSVSESAGTQRVSCYCWTLLSNLQHSCHTATNITVSDTQESAVIIQTCEELCWTLLVSFKGLTLAADRCWILPRPDSMQTLKAFVFGSGLHLLKQKAHVVPRRALPTETILSGYVSTHTAVSAWAWATVHVCVWTPGCLQRRRPSVSAWRWKGREGWVSINQARLEAQRLQSPFHCSASSALCHTTHKYTHSLSVSPSLSHTHTHTPLMLHGQI